MSVFVDGVLKYNFVVSTGLAGGPPFGTFQPQRMERDWRSRIFNMAPMPYSIFFHGHYAIHGTTAVKKLGQRASNGCVRLHPNNAAMLFNLVRKHGMANTKIVIEPTSSRARTAEVSADPQPEAPEGAIKRSVHSFEIAIRPLITPLCRVDPFSAPYVH